MKAHPTKLACLMLISMTVFYIIELEIVRYTQPTWVIPLPNVIFTLVVLIGAAAFIRKFIPDGLHEPNHSSCGSKLNF